MKIAVCVKQVPASQETKMDPARGTLIRNAGDAKMNPYDLPAIEIALRVKERLGGTVTVFTMGPPSAEKVLSEAFAMGADKGVLITDPAFSGADVLATSYTLSQAVSTRGPFDLLLFGRQTTDGDTAQVGPAVSARLGLCCVSWVDELCEVSDGGLLLKQSLSEGIQTVWLTFPCALTINQSAAQPRLPTLKGKLAAKKMSAAVLHLADLPDASQGSYGLDASPTRVERIFLPALAETQPPLTGTGEEVAACVMERIRTLLPLGMRQS